MKTRNERTELKERGRLRKSDGTIERVLLVLGTKLLLLCLLQVILLELAVERSLSNAEHSRCGELVTACLAQGPEDGAALQFFERQDLVPLGRAFAGRVLQIRGQVPHVQNGPRTQSHGPLDGVLELPHVPRPIVG